jgi:uroporphyrinogen decarboxylase
MNSRERVLQSMSFVQPDRVAVDLGAHRSSGIQAIAYARLRDYLGLPKRPPRVYDIPQQLAIIDDDVLDRFGVDCIELGRGFNQDEADWREWVLPDSTPCLIPHWIHPVREGNAWVLKAGDGTPIAVQKQGMVYFDQVHFPLKEDPESKLERLEAMLELDMWDAVAAPPGPVPRDENGARTLSEGARKLRQSTTRAIVGLFGGPIFEGGQQLFGMETYLILLATDPALVERFLDRLMAEYLRRLEFFLRAVGPYIDIILFSDDYGTQTAPQISSRMFRQYFKPRHQQIWAEAKRLAPVKILLHSCGSIRALMPDLIEAGLDAVNPVQITANKMEPVQLKADLGRQIVLWGGGCDTQQVLPNATPKEVREHVLRNLDILAPGGGFVFQQVHNIQANVPPENIVAMFDAVAEWNGA